MRETKFRGKRVDGKGWACGDLIRTLDDGIRIMQTINYEGNAFDEAPCTYQQSFEVIPASVGQYTGLKDKYGVEIYEGDKVDYCLREGLGEPYRSGLHDVIRDMRSVTVFMTNIEVTGNIHDNPELLKPES